jgi:hypothetical protein
MREDGRRVQRVIKALGRRGIRNPENLWCLNPGTACKVLIIKDPEIETAEVGSDTRLSAWAECSKGNPFERSGAAS